VARRAVERDDTPKYEPSIYNYKCSEDSSGSRSPTPSKEEQSAIETFDKDATQVNAQKSPHGDGEHSDNCSEVSDEGYRSLGAVQLSTANGNSASTQGSPTVADCQSEWTHILRVPRCTARDSIRDYHPMQSHDDGKDEALLAISRSRFRSARLIGNVRFRRFRSRRTRRYIKRCPVFGRVPARYDERVIEFNERVHRDALRRGEGHCGLEQARIVRRAMSRDLRKSFGRVAIPIERLNSIIECD